MKEEPNNTKPTLGANATPAKIIEKAGVNLEDERKRVESEDAKRVDLVI